MPSPSGGSSAFADTRLSPSMPQPDDVGGWMLCMWYCCKTPGSHEVVVHKICEKEHKAEQLRRWLLACVGCWMTSVTTFRRDTPTRRWPKSSQQYSRTRGEVLTCVKPAKVLAGRPFCTIQGTGPTIRGTGPQYGGRVFFHSAVSVIHMIGQIHL